MMIINKKGEIIKINTTENIMNSVYVILYLIIAITFLTNLGSASSVILSNISSEYELCIYTPSGYLEGCSNNTNSVNFSRNDYIFQLKHPDINLLNKPLQIFDWLPTIIGFLAVFVLVALFTIGLSEGFGKVISKILIWR